ncbi:hypothetical protein [Gemmatimonas sp.]
MKSYLSSRVMKWGVPALAGALAFATAAPLGAQIRGRPPVGGAPRRGPSQGWWFSGGAAGLVMNGINDGATGKRWEFGNDPLWQLRGTLEKALDPATTLGVSAGYGVVDVNVSRLPGTGVVDPAPGAPAVCLDSCAAQIETWQLMGQFRSGGGPGFHTFFEAQGGVNGFRNLRTRDTREQFGSSELQLDVAGSLGFGFGYTLSPGMVLALVQDFGMGWHAKDNLPDGTSRTYRTRATRAALRFKF